MNADDVVSLSRLIDAAMAQPAEARASWLDGLGPEHLAVLPALRRALALMDTAAGPAAGLPELRPRLSEPAAETPPQRIGPWRLLRSLGRGGMGEVWLAERADGAFEHQVALKLPHAALLSEVLRQRFARERDILAGLSHRHIARFLDAGVAEGRPYLAMEWIAGLPIIAHAETHALGLRPRIRLFCQVLDAVEHAHRRLVAHRDLKPSNILVTHDGEAKLLDFGIAKLLDDDAADTRTELTRAGGRMLTPDYAAPEQLAGHPVTTAVDIYSLGVVLYELLTGSHPVGRGASAMLPPGNEAPLASTRVSADRPDAAALRRALRGDLDAVLMRALESDPAQRYSSAAAFAADLQRVLADEPVQARRSGWPTRLIKFARRHRVESVLAAGLLFTVVAGVGAIAWAGVRAHDEAARAEREAARQKATKEFLVGVFKASDPRIASDQPRGTITARQLLDLGARRIEGRFANDPDTHIELLGILSDIYEELGENQRSHELLKVQTELARARYGDLHPVTLDCLLRGVDGDVARGDVVHARQGLQALDPLLKRAGRDDAPERGVWLYLHAALDWRVPSLRDQVERDLTRAAAIFAIHDQDHRYYPSVLNALAQAANLKGDAAEAVVQMRRAVGALERTPDRSDTSLTNAYRNLSLGLAYAGDFKEAVIAADRAANLVELTTGHGGGLYWNVASARAEVVHRGGDRGRAGPLMTALLEDLPPAGHPFRTAIEQHDAGLARIAMAQRLVAEGRPAEALPLLEEARLDYATAARYAHDQRQIRLEMAVAHSALGHGAQAQALLEGVLAEYRNEAGPADRLRLRTEEALARARWRRGDAAGAEQLWQQVLVDANGKSLSPVAQACEGMARVALLRHNASGALAWVHRGQAVLAHPGGAPDIRFGPELAVTEARALLAAGQRTEALKTAQAAVEALRHYDAPGSDAVADAEATLAMARGTAGR